MTSSSSSSSSPLPRTTYVAWRDFFATRDTDVLLRQCATADVFDKYVCVHFGRALRDEIESRFAVSPCHREPRKAPLPKKASSLVWV